MSSNARLVTWVVALSGLMVSFTLIPFGGEPAVARDRSSAPPSPPMPVVETDLAHATTPALRTIAPVAPEAIGTVRDIPMHPLPRSQRPQPDAALSTGDAAVQSQPGAPAMPSPVASFEGINNRNGVLPPDANGDIGYDSASGKRYYVQWVNLSLQMTTLTLACGPMRRTAPIS